MRENTFEVEGFGYLYEGIERGEVLKYDILEIKEEKQTKLVR